MKAVVQIYKTGELQVVEAPPPQLRPGWVLVKNEHSVISAGTEKTKVDTARKSLLGKAMARPDLVRKLVAKARREGLWKAWQTASDRLEQPITLGYSCAGRVIEVCGDVDGMCVGDFVACGGGTANHAEMVSVPKNLVVPVPEGVGTDAAAFATIGAIAMQGVRQAEVRLGEKIAVIGLGLIGLITVQLLKAAGCRVLGIDVDEGKLALGRELGCELAALSSDEGLEERVVMFTGGYGVDATIITAATSSNRPVEQAGELTREKGRVVVVGATGLEIPREPYYLKEIDFRISRSYGPGRYDPEYEDRGRDYPYGYVRFTEQRNMACFLELLQSGQVRLDKIITHRFPFEEAPRAYELLSGQKKEPYLGILLEYGRTEFEIPRRVELIQRPLGGDRITVGVIGAGHYATGYLLPAIKNHPLLQLGAVCTATGVSARQVGQRFGFRAAEADADAVIRESDAVLIATRHDEHAAYAIRALEKGKPVFVEKPLAITEEQLEQVMGCFKTEVSSAQGERTVSGEGLSALDGQGSTAKGQGSTGNGQRATDNVQRSTLNAQRSTFNVQRSTVKAEGSLMVGFNRRFAPATLLVKEHFESVGGTKQILIRVNAGPVPKDHWVNDPVVGGGRLVGEGCHFVDLALFLAGGLIFEVSAAAVVQPGRPPQLWEDFSIQMSFDNGSLATIVYTALGDPCLPKERIEVSGGGRSAVIDDFAGVELWRDGKRVRRERFAQDKGQVNEIEAWVKGLKNGKSPIPFCEIMNVHQACFAALRSMRDRAKVRVAGG
ncbi:MAG: bi-domain-containing oxidoreductase [Verrucomicrobiia bacterium]